MLNCPQESQKAWSQSISIAMPIVIVLGLKLNLPLFPLKAFWQGLYLIWTAVFGSNAMKSNYIIIFERKSVISSSQALYSHI